MILEVLLIVLWKNWTTGVAILAQLLPLVRSFSVTSPWHCVASPELRAVASADAASSVCLGMEAMRARCHCLKLLELAIFLS